MSSQKPRSRIEHWLLQSSGVISRNQTDIDGLRGIAVVMVFLVHAWSLSGSPRLAGASNSSLISPLIPMLDSGIDLFFVISGYLVSLKFLDAAHQKKDQPSLKQYRRERIFRIFPLYWVLLASVPLVMSPMLVNESSVFSLDGLRAFVLYIPMLSALFPWSFRHFFVISPVWTLTVELCFYILVPFIYHLFLGKRWRLFLPLSLLLSVGWLVFLKVGLGSDIANWYGMYNSPKVAARAFGQIILSAQIPTFAFAFATGLSVASIVSQRKLHPKVTDSFSVSQYLVPIGTALTLVVLYTFGSIKSEFGLSNPFYLVGNDETKVLIFYYLHHIAPVVGFGLILAGVVLNDRPHRLIGAAPFRVIGILGYGVYLWHFPVMFSQSWISWVAKLDPARRFLVAVTFGGVTTLVLSVVTWTAIERPFINRGKRGSLRVPDSEVFPMAQPELPSS